MKKATLIAILVTLSSFMFAGVNITYGNTYQDNAGTMETGTSFGVWFDVNDATAIGWEGGSLLVGLAGPAGTTVRLGYENGNSLGLGWNYDLSGGGTGWGTNVGIAVDFTLTDWDNDANAATADDGQGDFKVTLNLGLGAL